MPFRLTVPTAAVCLVALLAWPGAATAKIKFGVQAERNGSQTLSQAEVLRMRQGGVKLIRTPLEWELVQGRSPKQKYNFSNFDNLVRSGTQGSLPKLKILPILIGSPAWVARSSTNNEPPVTGSDLKKWKAFVAATVKHYKGTGAIDAWQVWNEPNLKTFWTNGKPDTEGVREAAEDHPPGDRGRRSVSQDSPGRHAGARGCAAPDAGLPDEALQGKGREQVLRRGGGPSVCRQREGRRRGVKRIRKIMDKDGDKKKALWVTEVGFASTGPSSPFTTSSSGQAALLKRGIRCSREGLGQDEDPLRPLVHMARQRPRSAPLPAELPLADLHGPVQPPGSSEALLDRVRPGGRWKRLRLGQPAGDRQP